MDALSKVLVAIEGDGPIARDRVRQWMTEGDLPTRGAVYFLTRQAWSRISPKLTGDEQCAFMRSYLLDCIVADPSHGDFLHSGFEAAWDLAAWLKHLLSMPNTDNVIREVSANLRAAYLSGDSKTRNRIGTGALEHILEAKELVPFFEDWRNDPAIKEEYQLALEWGEAHREKA